MQSYGKIFNIRVPTDKQPIINEYKELVTKGLHSDICYVTTMLIESFVKAHRKVKESTIINLIQQTIVINQNCTNIYGTTLKRSRRTNNGSNLNKQPLPKCSYCNNPAIRQYYYPHNGHENTCPQHLFRAPKGYTGHKSIADKTPKIVNNCFTLNHENKEKPQNLKREFPEETEGSI